VTINNGVLYQARMEVPSNVVTGRYTAETFAISRGPGDRLRGRRGRSSQARLRALRRPSRPRTPRLLYGLFAVGLSLLMGWLAGRVFRAGLGEFAPLLTRF
jgi:hypothetical protein